MSRSPPTITVPQAGRRPSSIAELADRAKEDVWPETRGLRDLLRAADRHWREGKEYLEKGDLDNAYISLARAAPLVLEKLPSHPDYKILLSDTQRHNLALNVQSILDNLINLKYALVDRCDTQLEQQPSSVSLGTTTTAPQNPPKPPTLLFSRPFHCPKPNCNKSYKFENGLKYHMAYGACSISPQKSAEHNQPPSSTPASSGSGNHSNPSATSLPSQASPLFCCPVPNCNRAYRQVTGLKYHLIHGNCTPKEEVDSITERLAQLLPNSSNTSSNTGVSVPDTTQGSHPNSTTSGPLPTASSRFSEARPSEIDREAEIRLRPFACGVGDCTRRYKNMNGLKYHYQHSGEHGAEGIALLNSGRHPLVLADRNVGQISRSGTSTQAQQVPIILAPLKKRRRACDTCRSSKIRCDLSLFECSQCQRSGRQCSFGQEERGRSRYRTRRAQSVPDPRKTNIDLPSQLTIFPPPVPFPAVIRNVKTEKANLEQDSKPQRARLEAVNVSRPKTSQPGRKQGEYKHIKVPKSPPPLTPGVSRPRSFSFNRPTERDPNFGRPYSRPSSRPTSRASSQLGSSPPSRSSSVHGSPISTSGLWWKSSLEKDPVSEQIKTSSAPNDPKPPSRLAIPLPTPTGNGRRHRGSYRGTVKKDHRRTSTTRSRRYSRPPSPHPSRPASRSSFSIPLERKSSFSHSSPVPVSGSSSRHSSRPSSRTSYYSPVQYSATSTSHKSWSSASSYDVETLFERYSPGLKPVKS